MKSFFYILLSAAFISFAGCGGSSSSTCQTVGLNVGPASATVDHTALAPANGQVFSASVKFSNSPGCAGLATAALVPSNWTASDPSVHFSAMPITQVTATCTATVANPITITASAADGRTLTGQATLTCN